jgi:hypothetical protein
MFTLHLPGIRSCCSSNQLLSARVREPCPTSALEQSADVETHAEGLPHLPVSIRGMLCQTTSGGRFFWPHFFSRAAISRCFTPSGSDTGSEHLYT